MNLKFIDIELQALQDCTQRARRNVLALVDCHNRGARRIVAMSDHHVATSSMDFDEANPSQRPRSRAPPAWGSLLTPPWQKFATFQN